LDLFSDTSKFFIFHTGTKAIEEDKLSKDFEQRIAMDKARMKVERNQAKAPTRAVAINAKSSSSSNTPVLSPLSSPTLISPTTGYMQQLLTRSKNVISSSPQQLSTSPFGSPLSANRAVLADLIATLNESYTDYDFSDAKPDDFAVHSLESVFNSVNLGLRDALEPNQRVEMWNLIDSAICIADCDILSYVPEDDDDPMALGEGKIWSWNYFFYNKKQKKLLFLACYAKSKVHDCMNEDYDGESYTFCNPKNVDVHVRARVDDADDFDMDFDDF